MAWPPSPPRPASGEKDDDRRVRRPRDGRLARPTQTVSMSTQSRPNAVRHVPLPSVALRERPPSEPRSHGLRMRPPGSSRHGPSAPVAEEGVRP